MKIVGMKIVESIYLTEWILCVARLATTTEPTQRCIRQADTLVLTDVCDGTRTQLKKERRQLKEYL